MSLKLVPGVFTTASFVGFIMAQLFAKDARLKLFLKWLFGATFVIALIVAIWPSAEEAKNIDSHDQIATSTGNNSPSTTISTTGSNSPVMNATTMGSNSPVYQATGNQIIGLSDEGLRQIREGMIAIQKAQESELKAKFNMGYILFTATERRQIVPLTSPTDNILRIDWQSGYAVSFTEDSVILRLPDMTIFTPESGTFTMKNGPSVIVRRRFEPWARPGFVINNNLRLAFKMVSTNADSVTIAMGLQSPPEPRPPMSELSK